MWNLFERYKGRKVLPSARQMNLIAAILNHVTSGTGVKMDTPIMPSTDRPWVIAIDTKWLKEFVGGGNSGNVGANKLVGTNASGEFTALASLLPSAPSADKVLGVSKDSTDVEWKDAGPTNPSSNIVDLSVSGEGSAAAKTDSWTFDGVNGVKVTKQTRTYYDHTAATPVLYGYYRTETYDRNGKLHSVSAETRYVIDQPAVGNLTT